jgi:hypothetical protein
MEEQIMEIKPPVEGLPGLHVGQAKGAGTRAAALTGRGHP